MRHLKAAYSFTEIVIYTDCPKKFGQFFCIAKGLRLPAWFWYTNKSAHSLVSALICESFCESFYKVFFKN